MEKIQMTREAFENDTFEFKTISFIPYAQKEEMAEKLVMATLICDSDGCAYMSYRYDLFKLFLIAEYYTNIDTTEWDSEEGHAMIFDYMTQFGNKNHSHYEWMRENAEFQSEMKIIDSIFWHMYGALSEKHELTSSLPYKIGKTFASILGDEDIIKTLAQNREVSEKMIDMMRAYKEHEETPKAGTIPMAMFAKK